MGEYWAGAGAGADVVFNDAAATTTTTVIIANHIIELFVKLLHG